jgi:hypothetical protein
MKEYKFVLFPFHSFFGTFKEKALETLLNSLWKGGYRMRKREFALEPRRSLGIFQRLSFGILFEKDPKKLEPDMDIRVLSDNDGLLFRKINSGKLQNKLNQISLQGYDLCYCFQYTASHLFFFSRSHYLFIFKKEIGKSDIPKQIHILEYEYRFWTQTIDEQQYENDLNAFLKDKELKYSVRTDSYRYLGFLKITSSVIIAQTIESVK